MTRKDSDSIAPTPINFYYFNMTGTQSFCDLLEKWYRNSGHSRPINFIQWNCYRELSGEDADLIAYDGVVLSALADKGFFAPVPKDLSAGDVFPWVIEKGRYRLRLYGLPIMMDNRVHPAIIRLACSMMIAQVIVDLIG